MCLCVGQPRSIQNDTPKELQFGIKRAVTKGPGCLEVYYSAFSLFFSKTLFDFKKSISGLIELKFSGKTPNEVLYAPIYFWGVYF